MPCKGCGKNVKRVIVRLRFIGEPGGKLMKGAPGNLVHGEIYTGPMTWAKTFKFWELVDPAPEVEVPEKTEEDSVFENVKDTEFKPDGKIPKHGEFRLELVERKPVQAPVVTEEDLKKKTRPQLMAFIDSRDGKYRKNMKKAVLLEIAKKLLES